MRGKVISWRPDDWQAVGRRQAAAGLAGEGVDMNREAPGAEPPVPKCALGAWQVYAYTPLHVYIYIHILYMYMCIFTIIYKYMHICILRTSAHPHTMHFWTWLVAGCWWAAGESKRRPVGGWPWPGASTGRQGEGGKISPRLMMTGWPGRGKEEMHIFVP